MNNNLIPNGNIYSSEQRLFLGSGLVPNVQSVSISYSTSATPLQYIGNPNVQYVPGGPDSASVSILSYMGNDIFRQYTGSVGVNGQLVNMNPTTNQDFVFVSGYMTDYRVRCSIGAIPTIDTQFAVFGYCGTPSANLNVYEPQFAIESSTVLATKNFPTGILQVASPNSMSIGWQFNQGVGGANIQYPAVTNRIQSFDIDIQCPKRPRYLLGKSRFFAADKLPITVGVSFTLEENDYIRGGTPDQDRLNTDFPFREKTSNLTFSFKDQNGNNLLSYAFDNMQLKGESKSIDANGQPIITARYEAIYI